MAVGLSNQEACNRPEGPSGFHRGVLPSQERFQFNALLCHRSTGCYVSSRLANNGSPQLSISETLTLHALQITRILQKRPDAGAGSDLTDTQVRFDGSSLLANPMSQNRHCMLLGLLNSFLLFGRRNLLLNAEGLAGKVQIHQQGTMALKSLLLQVRCSHAAEAGKPATGCGYQCPVTSHPLCFR